MLLLIDPMQGIPGGWKYVFPETGYVATGASFASLFTKCLSHAKANSLSTDELVNRIEDYVCRNLPAELQDQYCAAQGSPRIPKQSPPSNKPCGGCGGKKEK